jgi:cell wall-associated NlpC family hydrolase
MAFQGSLAELHLPDIIQLVGVSGKTGVFHLVDGDQEGQIYLRNGQIIHAELAELWGEEAVYALAIWRQGEFRFDAETAPPRETIQRSNTSLLMEAARRLDEWRVLSKKIPSVDRVPEFVILENREGQINLNTMEWLLLSKIDGQRSLRAIAGAAKLSVFDAAKLLYGLVATGLIRLKESPASPDPAAPVSPSTREPTTPGEPAAPTEPATTRESATPQEAVPPLTQLTRVRDECVALLGPAGESVVQRHFQRARTEIEGGAGVEAVEAAVQQIARAAAVLKGSAVAEAVLQIVRKP